MGHYVVVRPKDDGNSEQASDWCDRLSGHFSGQGHVTAADVNDTTPADTANITAALGKSGNLVCYFGHGDEVSWLTNWNSTITASNVHAAHGKAVISVACKTGCNLGAAAITAGVVSWLGFTVKVPVMAPYLNADPIGDALVDALACLGNGGTMQDARDEIATRCAQLVRDFDDGGQLDSHPNAEVGYYAALALSDHVVLHGKTNYQPLL